MNTSKVLDLIDALAAEVRTGSKDGHCDWCGKDTEKAKNARLYKLDWHRGDNDEQVSLCSHCRSAAERGHVGTPITNPNHPKFGEPIERWHSMFIKDVDVLDFEGYEDRLAEVMVKKMQVRVQRMNKAGAA